MCKWCATYCWKDFDKGYNFSLDLTLIKGLHKKLWSSKVQGVPISEIPTWEYQNKMIFGCSLYGYHKEYYKGEGGGFPKSKPWWILWVHVCSWLVRAPKVLQLCTKQLVVWFVWIIDSLITCLNPHPGALAHPSTPEVLWVQECTPIFSFYVVFTFDLAFESFKECEGASHGIRAPVKLDPPIGEFRWHWKGFVNQYRRPWWKNSPRT